MVEVLTYTRSIAAGELVSPQDVAWTKVQSHLAPADAPNDADAVIGLAARRPLREGAGVGLHDLASPTVIRKDQLVSVAYVDEGVNLVLQGKALSDASVGATVQVLNTQSKKTIEAVAAGPARAVAGPGADSLRARTFASLTR
jgi:flagella basal body P-ring formation protein FlgA